MDNNRTTTTADTSAEAPLEWAIAGRYARLSPLRRSAEILGRGESLCTMAEARGSLASEIFGRWGRAATGGREQLPFVAGFSRSGAGVDVAPLAEEPSAEADSPAAPQGAVRLPRLINRQDMSRTGGKELPPLAPKSAPTIAVSDTQRSSGTDKRAGSLAPLSQAPTVSAEASPAISLPVAASPSRGVVSSVAADNTGNLSEPRPDSIAGFARPLVRQPSEAARTDGASPVERSEGRSPNTLPAMAKSPVSVNPPVADVSVPVTAAGGSSRLVPVVTRLSASREPAKLPVAGVPGVAGAAVGESVPLEPFRGQTGHGKRPVLLRKLAAGGSEVSSGGDPSAAAAVPVGTSRQDDNRGQASTQSSPVVGRGGAGLGQAKGADNRGLPVAALGRSQESRIAASQPVRRMADAPSAFPGSEPALRMTGSRRQPKVTFVEGPIVGNAGVTESAASLSLGIDRQAATLPEAVATAAQPGFVQRSSAADLRLATGPVPATAAAYRLPEQPPATAATVSAPAADITPSSRQSGLSREELEQVAAQVYTVIEQRLTIEKERRGL